MTIEQRRICRARRDLLEDLGVNLSEIARQNGWASRQYIYNVLNGRLWPSSRVIAAVAQAVGLPPDEFRDRFVLPYAYRRAA